MLTNESGQILYDTPGIRLLWSVSKKAGNHYLQPSDLDAKGDGTITDKVFGVFNEKDDGRFRLLADKVSLNNPETHATSIEKVGKRQSYCPCS